MLSFSLIIFCSHSPRVSALLNRQSAVGGTRNKLLSVLEVGCGGDLYMCVQLLESTRFIRSTNISALLKDRREAIQEMIHDFRWNKA